MGTTFYVEKHVFILKATSISTNRDREFIQLYKELLFFVGLSPRIIVKEKNFYITFLILTRKFG